MKRGTRLLLALFLLSVGVSMQAMAAETLVEVKRVKPTKTESGHMVVELDDEKIDKLFTYPNELFLPGDVAEGTFRFRLEPGIRPVTLKLTAGNLGGTENQAIYEAVSLKITNGSSVVYNGKLSELDEAEIAVYENDSKVAIDKTVDLQLVFDKQTGLNSLQNQTLQFNLTVTADMMDYTVITPKDYVPGNDVEVYLSHYNNNYYYTATGTPALESQHVKEGEQEGYRPDYLVEVNDEQGTADDYYIDYKDGNLKVYIGQDLHFGTADDAKELLKADGAVNGSNVRRGTKAEEAEQFGGGNHAAGEHYTNGDDGIPGTEDDQLIYAGTDGEYGTEDDYFIKSRRANVRPGKDLIWGTIDDQMWDVGTDAVHGNWNDTFLGYPNDTTQRSSGSYSGAVTGSFDSSVSPVGFAKSVEGTWSKDVLGNWTFVSDDGEKAKSKWVNIHSRTLDSSDWYYFNANGVMQTGWQRTGNGKWYYLRTENDARQGAMVKGWYYDSSDGNYYYLDPVNGVMLTGWQKINGKYYYFAEVPVGTSWFWDSSIGRWTAAKTGGLPTGALYRNTVTPDGSRVDANGARIDG